MSGRKSAFTYEVAFLPLLFCFSILINTSSFRTLRDLLGSALPQILEEVERRREISPALVYPFMRSVMEAPFPAPGRTVTVKSFLPGSGNEVTLKPREEMLISSFVPSNHSSLPTQSDSEWKVVHVNNRVC